MKTHIGTLFGMGQILSMELVWACGIDWFMRDINLGLLENVMSTGCIEFSRCIGYMGLYGPCF